MPTFTVHQPPPKKGEIESAPERFAFVRDGFHFWAFVLAPLWLLAHRLWLVFVIYVASYVLVGIGLVLLGVSGNVKLLVALLIALAMGFEAASLQRWTLQRRGWKTLGFVVGEDTEAAERHFYTEWAKRPPEPAPVAPEQRFTTPVRRGPPSGNDVIGLFPEPRA